MEMVKKTAWFYYLIMIKVMGGIEELEDAEVEVDRNGNLIRANKGRHPKAL